ncbi:MAG TPA: hypothetical protein PL149_09335 [Candidatus Kapabacteria bacterium]|nr:hypothetical protein [Candidatus Kapabacteria bacterium]
MFKVIAILQIICIFTSNIGVNVYLHYCNSTNSVVVALSADAATCKDHICCDHHHHTNPKDNHSNLCCNHLAESSNNLLAFKDLECCQNGEKYFVLTEKSLQNNNFSNHTYNFTHKVDYNLPFYFNVIVPEFYVSESFDFYKYLKQKTIFSSIYFSSNLI